LYTLHYYPGNASLLAHMVLRETGAPFTLALVDRQANAHKSAAYLTLNPNGLIPVLEIAGEAPMFETAAIAIALAERHPEAGLMPPPGDPLRAQFFKWMLHLSNTPQATYVSWFYPFQFADDEAAQAAVKAKAAVRLDGMFDRIAAQLGDGPWLLGDRFSAADLFLFMLIRWGRGLPCPPRTVPALGGLAEQVLARPAVQATLAAEGLQAPFV
jgi:glutathione S-transferase